MVQRIAERYCDEYLYVPKVVTGKHCGYFEFVESKTPEVSQEEAFHYHIGQFCALVRMLGSVDLHRENILSYGSPLVPVDLETVLAPRERRDFFQFSTILRRSMSGSRLLFDSVPCSVLSQTESTAAPGQSIREG